MTILSAIVCAAVAFYLGHHFGKEAERDEIRCTQYFVRLDQGDDISFYSPEEIARWDAYRAKLIAKFS